MGKNVYERICELADGMREELTAQRQDFHKHAEGGWFEVRTSSIIADQLTKLGYEVLIGRDVCLDESRMGLPDQEALDASYKRSLEQGAIMPYAEQMKDGFTGVIGILRCGEGPVIAMRFDIDALGVFEEKADSHRPAKEGFCSINDGTMHACGHDGHAAIGLGTAKLLMEMKDELKGTIKLIFQPCEEGVRGAKSIVDHGHLDDVDYVIGNHMADTEGTDYDIFLSDGISLATTKFDAFFIGKAAHAGAVPEKGDNAMLAAATAVANLYGIPRCSMGDTRINVGTLHAGSGRNVVCDRAKMEVEVRGKSTEANNYMMDYARRIVESSAAMHGCTSEMKLMGAAEALVSNMEMMERCKEVCETKLALRVAPMADKTLGSEDYSYMVNRVESHGGKGMFFMTLTPISGPAHSKIFDIREEALPNAVKVFCGMALDLMERGL